MRSGRRGISLNEGLLYGLVVLIIGLGLFAVSQSMTAQRRAANAYEGWYEDKAGYDKVKAEQKATGKPVLVYFYATWCPHCKKFSAQVLSDPLMQDYVKRYPRVRIAPDNGQAEKDLMAEYGAQGYPSFYVVMPGGVSYKIETYTESGTPRLKTPKEFIASIETVIGQNAVGGP